MIRIDGLHDILMAITARRFGDGAISGRYLNGLVEISRRECPGMIEAINGLGMIFTDKIVWGVAVVTDCHPKMARFSPCLVLFVHNVAIGAGRGIVGHIRSPFGVNECIPAHTGCRTGYDSNDNSKTVVAFHPFCLKERFGCLRRLHSFQIVFHAADWHDVELFNQNLQYIRRHKRRKFGAETHVLHTQI